MPKIKLENLRIHRNECNRDKSFYWDISTGQRVSENDPGFPKKPFYIPEEPYYDLMEMVQIRHTFFEPELLAFLCVKAWFVPHFHVIQGGNNIQHEFFIPTDKLEEAEKELRQEGFIKAADQAKQLFSDLEDVVYIHVIEG
jgi:hypothetical protein